MDTDWDRTLASWRSQIDQRLRELLRLVDNAPKPLREAIEYSLLAPGKRIRPILTNLAAGIFGGIDGQALSAGCAVEMVHAYSLIHDDLPAMDDDDLRRGRPTVHKKYGEALAILTGDALLTLAFNVLAAEYPPATSSACTLQLAQAAGAIGMVGGQVEDLTWDGKISGETQSASIELLQRIHAAKTGELLVTSLRLGQLVMQGERNGGPDEAAKSALDEYGRCFGLVFQITDDLLDVEGQTELTGKRVGKDGSRGKLTYPGLLGVDESRRRVRDLAERAQDAITPLGSGAAPLRNLMDKMVTRDR